MGIILCKFIFSVVYLSRVIISVFSVKGRMTCFMCCESHTWTQANHALNAFDVASILDIFLGYGLFVTWICRLLPLGAESVMLMIDVN